RGLNIPWRQGLNKLKKIRFVQEDAPRRAGSSGPKPRPKGWHRVVSETELRKEMDALLDKITRVGYENLSNTEKERLLELSSRLSNDGNHRD
ncbi:MAG: hypothetical protein K9M55_10470, partial [Candidatus Marinimicrobia bacterium]|nr:hypothetical protein [Candidatus Neomarinimicrobiota bacterium]